MQQSHRIRGRSLAASLIGLALCLPGAMLASGVAAQDPTEAPLPTDLAGVGVGPTTKPSALCGVLTADEVSSALGVTLEVTDSTEYDCSWGSDSSDTSLLVTRDAGDFELDAQEVFPDGVSLTVDGKPAWYTPEGLVLFVDVGDGMLFTLEYFGTQPDDLDLQGALTALATSAVPQLAAIPVPTEEPMPTPQGDPVLEALIPTSVGDAETVVDVYTARDLIAGTDPDDPDASADIGALQDFAAEHGRTIDDISFADAYFDTGTAVGDLFAIRVAGADVTEFADQLADLVLQLDDPRRTSTTIAGKPVTIVTEGPLPTGSPDPSADPDEEPLPPSYLYASGEVLYIVSAEEPQLSELFAALR